ncbi:MAG: transcriptional regulator MntR [Candidatus Thorarchaeota archaeon]|nr:transcriptional regulator MntR [Candidatus Thorarchaeota archaeon]
MVKTREITGLTEAEQHYVETVYSLIKERGYARVVDIASTLNVKPPSVTSMLQKLDKQKFVNYTKYRGVVLAPKGKSFAETLERRHQALKKFLIMIGVKEENAEEDACDIEHRINPESVEKLVKFVEFVQSAPQPPFFLEHLRYYDKTGKHPSYCRLKAEGKCPRETGTKGPLHSEEQAEV